MKPERHIAHLEYRASGFFWRRRIPRKIAGKTNQHLRLSLRTHCAITATTLGERLNALSDLLLEAAAVANMTPTEVHTLVTETLAREVLAADRKRALAPRRNELEARCEDAQVEHLLEQLRSALRLRDYSLAENAMRATARSLSLPADESAPEWRAAAFETMRGLLDLTEDRARRDRGVYDEPSPFFQSARRKASTVLVSAPLSPIHAASDHTIDGPTTLASTPDALSSGETVPGVKLTPHAASRTPTPSTEFNPHSGAALPKGASEPWTVLSMGKIASDQIVMAPRNDQPPQRDEEPEQQKSPLLSAAIKLFLDHVGEGHSYRRARPSVSTGEKSRKQMENASSTMKKVLAILGDVPISCVTEGDLSDMFELLHDMPQNFTRSETLRTQFENGSVDLVKYIERSLTEEELDQAELAKALEAQGESPRNIEETVAKHRVKRYSAQTIYRIMQEVKRLFEFARKKRWIVWNPMDEVIWTTKEVKCAIANEGDRKRKPWFAKLEQFLRLPLFTQPLKDVGDPLFWASLIALNTGMRLEEICQLNVEDFACCQGVHYMHVRSTDTQSAKTENSVRIVPLNHNLLKIGLLKLVELRRSQNELALFPYLKRNSRGVLSSKVSNMFRRMNILAGLYESRLDFHSFRMTVNQRMIAHQVSHEIRCTLLGHVLTGTNHEHYTQGFPLQQLHKAAEHIDFDLSSVLDPFAAAAADHNVTSLSDARARKVISGKSA